MTAEEFLEWSLRSENSEGLHELEDGRIVEVPPPKHLHGVVCWLVAHILGNHLAPRGGYVVTNDAGLIVKRRPDTVRGPDLMAFVTRPDFAEIKSVYWEITPDLIVEVLSPTDRPGKTDRRVKQYLKRGIPLVWVVDPEDRNVIVYAQNQESKTLDETDELTGDGILPGFACKVGDFFAWPTQPSATSGD